MKGRPWKAAGWWLAALIALFLVSYMFANWVAGLRANLPSLTFAWERQLPFLAWTIVPYWTSDLLYGLSIFLCRTREELEVHARRLVAVQLISVAAFLLYPMQCAFVRPPVEGLFGFMFKALMGIDRPFNQAPSLHVSLAVLLGAKFDQHLTGWPRWFMRGWFALIVVSAMTTYQHQFVDLPTGIWTGLLCLALFPYPRRTVTLVPRSARSIRIAGAYLAGGLTFAIAAFGMSGIALLLLWPAGALLVVSGVYWTGRVDLFGKSEGRMPASVQWLLAPYVAGAWINSRLWTLGQPPAREIADGVWLGRVPGDAAGFASLVDLTAEIPVNTQGLPYRAEPLLDLIPPAPAQLASAVRAIEELAPHRPTLVFCALGYSRSAAAVAAWLAATGRAESPEAAVAMLAEKAPSIVLGPQHQANIGNCAYAEEVRDEV